MKISVVLLFLCFSMFLTLSSSADPPSSPPSVNNSTCPLDLNYVLRIPWNTSMCQNFHPLDSVDHTHRSHCCQTLLSLFGIGLAHHLKETSMFNLPDLRTSNSCLYDFQSKLSSLSLPDYLTSSCFDPLQFVVTPDVCAKIQTIPDWIQKLGKTTPLNQACKPDLTDHGLCSTCVTAVLQVQQDLTEIDRNSSHATTYCYGFAILYAAGIVNELGPESYGAVTCLFGMSVYPSVVYPYVNPGVYPSMESANEVICVRLDI